MSEKTEAKLWKTKQASNAMLYKLMNYMTHFKENSLLGGHHKY